MRVHRGIYEVKKEEKKTPCRVKGKKCFKTAASVEKCSWACDQAHLFITEQLDSTGVTDEGIPLLMISHKAVPEGRVSTAAATDCEGPAVPLWQQGCSCNKIRERFKHNCPQADERRPLSMSLFQHRGLWVWVVTKLCGALGCFGLSFAICRRNLANTSPRIVP